MNAATCQPGVSRRAVLAISAMLCAQVALAQYLPAAPAPVDSLEAELFLPRPVYAPGNPIPVRFHLANPTDQTIEIPLEHSLDGVDGVALPLELVLGSPDQPALTVQYLQEKPTPIRAPAREARGEPAATIRLAPRGSIGAVLDLRDLYKQVRYSGEYRLEWRPLGGRLAPAVITFRVETRKDAIFVTDFGKLTFSLFYDKAPQNVENFVQLARDGFYNGRSFHRIVPGFTIQGGCPNGLGNGMRPDGRTVPAEFHDESFDVGTLALARKPDDPNSASCQFFICLARAPELDGKYTAIGKATDEESLRTLQALGALATNRSYRPTQPVVIRSVVLVDSEPTTVRSTKP